MNRLKMLLVAGAAAALACSVVAQDKKADDKPKAPAAKPDEKKDAAKPAQEPARAGAPAEKPKDGAPAMDQQMMDMMMKLGAPGENHKMLADMVGEWTTVNKHWHDQAAPPSETKGTATYKSILGGRFIVGEHKAVMLMPGPDGKPQEFPFEGFGISGYDNAKQKFVNTWVDNMGTMILPAEGMYDAASKSIIFTGEMEMMPGMKVKFREVIKIIDKNKHVFEWHDNMTGKEERRMEITYTRKA